MGSLQIDLMKLASRPSTHISTGIKEKTPLGTGLSFEDLLRDSMKQVNNLQVESDDLVNKLATGDVDDT